MPNYYVYIYLNQMKPGKWFYKNLTFDFEPFYVGKGTNKREIEHLRPYSLQNKSYKNSTIKSIIENTSEQPIHYRIFENITNKESIEIEKDIISHFGRKDLETGILCNHTDGGEGANNFSKETLQKVGRKKKKVYQYDLGGKFIKEWESLSSIDIVKNPANISTSIKRNGTYGGFIWKYEYIEIVEPTIKYQMPIKYKDIKQIDKKTNKILAIFENIKYIEIELKLRKGAGNKIIDCINGKQKTAYNYIWKL